MHAAGKRGAEVLRTVGHGSVVRAIEQSLSTQISHKQQAATNFDVTETIRELEEEMLTAANNLEFEKAAVAVSYRKGKKRR